MGICRVRVGLDRLSERMTLVRFFPLNDGVRYVSPPTFLRANADARACIYGLMSHRRAGERYIVDDLNTHSSLVLMDEVRYMMRMAARARRARRW